ncbi:GNAT family N-acetyltransferase [Nocardia niigatensis]
MNSTLPARKPITHSHHPQHQEDRFSVTTADRCVGYARVTDHGDEIWIDEIAVHPEHREQGIGTRLLDAVLTHHAGRRIALSCDPYNPEIWTDPDTDTIGGMGWHHLTGWYTEHGFRAAPDRREICCMVRDTTTPPTT